MLSIAFPKHTGPLFLSKKVSIPLLSRCLDPCQPCPVGSSGNTGRHSPLCFLSSWLAAPLKDLDPLPDAFCSPKDLGHLIDTLKQVVLIDIMLPRLFLMIGDLTDRHGDQLIQLYTESNFRDLSALVLTISLQTISFHL